MNNTCLIFTGQDPLNHSIRVFFQEFGAFVDTHGIPNARVYHLLDNVIRSPAKEPYDVALADNRQMAFPNAPAAGAPALEWETYHSELIRIRKEWLIANFQGEDQQKSIRWAISRMIQRRDESPRTFYNRINTALASAG